MDVATLGDVCDVVDLSNHKPGVDLRWFKDRGWAGVGLKATEGNYFTDGLFAGYLDAARAIDWPAFAYHWQIRDISVSDQVRLVKRVVPTDCPLGIDVERYQSKNVVVHSGGAAVSRDLVHGLQDAGYQIKFNYMPYWYFTEMGSPDLSGLPPLWGSSYGANRAGGARENLSSVSPSAFNGYGNVEMTMLQYTSVGQPGTLDFNLYKGTAAEFRDYLYGTTTAPKRRPHRSREED